MTYLFVVLLIAAVTLGPWLGKDSRGLDPDCFEPTHPLSPDNGANRC